VIDECIHGLERDRCDVCSPKVAPKRDTPAPAKVRAATSPRRSAPPSQRGVASTAPRKPTLRPLNVGEQRIYHVTHVSNLEGILSTGALLADASDAWLTRPALDISSPENREARRRTPVAGDASPPVADYVPFFLSPAATVWDIIRAGTPDPRLSPVTRDIPAAEFVILVSTIRQVSGIHSGDSTLAQPPIVVADGDAALPLTRFSATTDTHERMLRRILLGDDDTAAQRAEFLVRNAVPLEAISLIGVAHNTARDSVREILSSSDFTPRVAVHPPCFAAQSA
jgi:ssDNA thymidine ADP-ribosyltransferase, DarT